MSETTADQPTRRGSQSSAWFLHSLLFVLPGVAALLAYVLAGGFKKLEAPPGPILEKLEINSDGTVIIRVKPDHQNKTKGATFVTAPKSDSWKVSHVVISGPVDGPPIAGFPYELPLDEKSHLHEMTKEIAKASPEPVPLKYEYAKLDGLYGLLSAAQKADPKVEFRVTTFCWYDFEKKCLLSTQDKALKVDVIIK